MQKTAALGCAGGQSTSQLYPLVDLLKELLRTAGLVTHVSLRCIYSVLEQNLPQSAVSVRMYGVKVRAVP